jgi:hypothetical protein
MIGLLTWGDWLTSSGFGGTTAVVAAALAFLAARRSAAVQRENAHKDQWWDRLKWAVELALSGDEAGANVGLAAFTAIAQAEGSDADELEFIKRINGLFLATGKSGTLEEVESYQGSEEGEEDPDGLDRS